MNQSPEEIAEEIIKKATSPINNWDNWKGPPWTPIASSLCSALIAETITKERQKADGLKEAAQRVIDNPGCNDPDCCENSIANERARNKLIDALANYGGKE